MKKLTAADALVLAGIGAIAVGLWFIYPPLAGIWVGAIALLFGVLFQRQRKEGGN